jgi:hypothetical protein
MATLAAPNTHFPAGQVKVKRPLQTPPRVIFLPVIGARVTHSIARTEKKGLPLRR